MRQPDEQKINKTEHLRWNTYTILFFHSFHNTPNFDFLKKTTSWLCKNVTVAILRE